MSVESDQAPGSSQPRESMPGARILRRVRSTESELVPDFQEQAPRSGVIRRATRTTTQVTTVASADAASSADTVVKLEDDDFFEEVDDSWLVEEYDVPHDEMDAFFSGPVPTSPGSSPVVEAPTPFAPDEYEGWSRRQSRS